VTCNSVYRVGITKRKRPNVPAHVACGIVAAPLFVLGLTAQGKALARVARRVEGVRRTRETVPVSHSGTMSQRQREWQAARPFPR
jgi:hypothetical protein